ncbi:hypothetical protein [Sphingobacterium lumbrici]|uniref:hypothetical protein n=1 Tax=Sphingobacterium lumbrici TaxID=2559600 RepID=UPI00112C9176|nr:hypothetical protein [Sphingobacterium lumbrici]
MPNNAYATLSNPINGEPTIRIKQYLTEGTFYVTAKTKSMHEGYEYTYSYKIIPTRAKEVRFTTPDTIKTLRNHSFKILATASPSFVIDKSILYDVYYPNYTGNDVIKLGQWGQIVSTTGATCYALDEGKVYIDASLGEGRDRCVVFVKKPEDYILASITKDELSNENGVYTGKLAFNLFNDFGKAVSIKSASVLDERNISRRITSTSVNLQPDKNLNLDLELKTEHSLQKPKQIRFIITMDSKDYTYAIDY